MLTEEWKTVPGFDGYEVSDYGRLRRAEREVVRHGKTVTVPARMLTPTRQASGYYHVTLRRDGKSHQDRLHRLVAAAFLPNDDEARTFVNHKNEDKSDTRVSNLEWLSPGDNTRYGTSIQRSSQLHRKPVVAYDKDGNEVARYNSIRDANKAVGALINSGHISEAARKNGMAYGLRWARDT